ncbi:MAG: hypothetical protein WBR24_16190 [Desulfobacterales bacterium]|jgi:hypothetical protein
MKEATSLKANGETVASPLEKPFSCRRFQIKRTHRWAFGPAAGNQVLDWILDAFGLSRNAHTWGKWIHYRRACAHNWDKSLENRRFEHRSL